MLKIFRLAVVAFFSLIACSASYALNGAGDVKLVQKTQQMIQSLPEDLRCCYLCEMEELVFMEDGSFPYSNGGQKEYNANEQNSYKLILQGAKFISLDGQPRDWYGVLENSGLRYSTWVEIKRGVGKCGKDAVNRPFKEDIQKLKKLFARRNRILDEIKRGRYNPEKYTKERIPGQSGGNDDGKAEAQALARALAMLKEMKSKSARNVVLSAITGNTSAKDLFNQAYASPEGELIYAFDALEKAKALEDATKIVDMMPSSEASDSALQKKHEKALTSLKRGRNLRALRLESFSRSLDAARACVNAEGAGQNTTELMALFKAVEDPVCRVAVADAVVEGYTPQELFENYVEDGDSLPVNCYDIILRSDAEETLLKLMAGAEQNSELREAIAQASTKERAELANARHSRENRIKAARSRIEAQEARERLRKAEAAE